MSEVHERMMFAGFVESFSMIIPNDYHWQNYRPRAAGSFTSFYNSLFFHVYFRNLNNLN